MQIVNTIMGPFDEARYKKLKHYYAAANGSESFIENLAGRKIEWSTDFAKYMIEFLDAYFQKPKS